MHIRNAPPFFGTKTSAERQGLDDGSIAPACKRSSEELKLQIQEMLDSGVIQHSSSAWASPIVLAPKPNGSMRLCIDYRELNAVTKKDAYPLPRITDLLEKLGGARFFTTMDMASGFHQIPLAPFSFDKRGAKSTLIGYEVPMWKNLLFVR